MATFGKQTIINDTGFIRLPVGTTNQRPSSPQVGMIRWNTTEEYAEFWNGEDWAAITGGASLYEFTNATFTSGGSTGVSGPSLTQARNGLTGTGVDGWKNNTAFFNTSNGIQLWTVPADGTYRIETWGAMGGGYSGNGSYGSRMRGDFNLTAGDTIKILVGQMGGPSYGGGGGGTFVATNSNTALICSGGGNTNSPWSGTRSHATTSTTGQSGSGFGGGSGGAGGNSSRGVYGGAGFSGNAPGSDSCSASRPQSFTNGGQGGQSCNAIGGFGGGSATDGCCYGASGAGGGYSGGGGTSGSSQYGGGGGSFNSGSNQSNSNGNTSGAQRADHGQVVITAI